MISKPEQGHGDGGCCRSKKLHNALFVSNSASQHYHFLCHMQCNSCIAINKIDMTVWQEKGDSNRIMQTT